MKILSLRRVVVAAALLPLAACGPDEPRSVSAPGGDAQSANASATVTAVVQPQPLTLTPVGPGSQLVGEAQTVTVRPVVAGERLDLEPVTQ